jgi:iron(III) transport system ATP-binding protein
MSLVRLESLKKVFGDTVAVDNVTLEIASGDLFFLLGPSGCGKTTLLRMIAGFATPTSGRIFIGDREVTKMPAERRDTGMVFQSYALWPHMSVRENVAFGLKVRKMPRAQVDTEVERALALVRMENYGARKPNELSGGQQQRVALARALAFKPTVLLLDEPLSNLDAKLRIEMRSEIRRIVDELSVTTIYVTHDQKEALSLADDMIVMCEGCVVQRGAPRALYRRPENRFTAEFLGETNLLAGELRRIDDSTIAIMTQAGELQSVSFGEDVPAAGNVTVSVRPESLTIGRDGEHADMDGATIEGRLLETLFLGEIAQHHVEISDGVVLKVLELNPDQAHGGKRGDKVTLFVAPEDVVLLSD